jgi:hypothetical protein
VLYFPKELSFNASTTTKSDVWARIFEVPKNVVRFPNEPGKKDQKGNAIFIMVIGPMLDN